ncbi:F0F1 ATP synthase subunit delta [Thiohalomonas denitrificans]|uniref:ATP synthase subunit delta n=1 Tax=Thiohalomonas denitrificans TaxID=415747 RepID=A0A1G5QRB5_9GAMM|nr:F0F1 ATP synthase subunit delta [Thiohalomonas denitrificans]SCZ64395.1 F-type H+-transporting ATPase subunit delta [Thiohalomonas denitrificans]
MAELITIARPYAQAIFSLARDEGDLKGWSDMLAFAALVASDPDMAALIEDPRVDREQTATIFLDVCGERLNAGAKNTIRVLAENNRLELLPEIAVLYEVERATAEGTLRAEVTSAHSLSNAQKKAIASALTKRFGRDVTLDCKIDEELLGGAIIRAGDVVIDGSVIGKLDKLAHQLLR